MDQAPKKSENKKDKIRISYGIMGIQGFLTGIEEFGGENQKIWQINYYLQSLYIIKNYVIKAAGKCSIFLICVFFVFDDIMLMISNLVRNHSYLYLNPLHR
ncbi:unnamed protein product [Paramecium octaurelia]|uniref:Uncharacterized protein n=1 Tax=Paramecium octaurelia TaxID=43137 RepID=A0A8S1T6K8_PAROT|nr:unnamed protein product [Paramecium octaurelia]